MSYLEGYLNSASYMPEDVLRCLEHMRLMDDRLLEATKDWGMHKKEYLEISKSANPEAHTEKLNSLTKLIQHEEELMKQFSAEKIATAKQAETLVRSNISRLDDSLEKLRLELQVSEMRIRDTGTYDTADRGRRRRQEQTLAYDDVNFMSIDQGPDDELVAGTGDKEILCKCMQPSEGEMVQCDKVRTMQCNKWFHFKCVGLTASPEGDWYCEDCVPFAGNP